ncbi:DUF1360 domain-containing protein [Halobacillus litoralis]|uniref:DUF1360 domain-containing protein n=1 Tax=Halobacillus litoralis TaxID=45668 RepID=UPI001CD58FEE|nr:DUF1360 domain-containing protein [Halobacillus litoralis]MCA0969564.1 DUF1360 domain-containing protein [Halobacillus litoralis]
MLEVNWIHLFILSLAAFRLTRLIVDDLIMEWLRKPFTVIRVEKNENGEKEEWIEPTGFIGEGLTCQWCVGVWSSLLIIVFYTFVPYGVFLVLLLAVAGLQSILYNWSERH